MEKKKLLRTHVVQVRILDRPVSILPHDRKSGLDALCSRIENIYTILAESKICNQDLAIKPVESQLTQIRNSELPH